MIRNLFLYQNDLGIFNRNIGAIQYRNLTLVSNGNQMTVAEPNLARDQQAQIDGAIFVGTSALTTQTPHRVFKTGRRDGFLYKNILFQDYSGGLFIDACDGCRNELHDDWGARIQSFSNLRFQNAVFDKIITYSEPQLDKDIFRDLDGSLQTFMGITSSGGSITPYFDHLNVQGCQILEAGSKCNAKCLVCDNTVKLLRLNFKVDEPFDVFQGAVIKFKGLNAKDPAVESDILYRYTHTLDFRGYAFPIVSGHSYEMRWNNGGDFEKLYSATSRYWSASDSIMIKTTHSEQRELFESFVTGYQRSSSSYKDDFKIENSETALSSSDHYGAFQHNKDTKVLNFKIDGDLIGSCIYQGFFCRFTCSSNPDDDPEVEDVVRLWSKQVSWESSTNKVPVDGDDVEILPNWQMKLDENSAKLNKLVVKGVLLFDDTVDDLTLFAKIIVIESTGKLMIGTEQVPYNNKMKILLSGERNGSQYQIAPSFNPVNKGIVVKGLFFVNAAVPSYVQTRLSAESLTSADQISVKNQVGWKTGDRIVIASSTKNHLQHEIKTISHAENSSTFTLDSALAYDHFGGAEVINLKRNFDMSAEVGLLSRNVVIEGEDQNNFGCTVQVVSFVDFVTSKTISGQLNIHGV